MDSNLKTVVEKLKFLYPEKEQCPISVIWMAAEKSNDGQIPFIIKADSLREGETMDVSLRVEYAGTDDLAEQSNILSHLLYDMDVADCPEEPASVLSNNEKRPCASVLVTA